MSRVVLWLAMAVGAVAAGMLAGQVAWGADDWDVAGKTRQPAANGGNMFGGVMAPRDFDQWVFGGKSRDDLEETLTSLLALRVDAVAHACKLSEVQRQKLELAGQGDVKRFLETVDQIQERFRQVGQDQQKFQEIAREVGPLQVKIQTGDLGETTLYQKVLKGTLDREQAAQYEQQERERRTFRYEARIELVLSMLESTMPLRAEQHERFVKLLLEETEPPKKFGGNDQYVVLYLAGKLKEEKLKAIFDETQWQTMKKALRQARGMEQFLKSNGFVP